MNHIELQIKCGPEYSEILMAEVSMIGFDTIEENQDGFNAYILEGDFNEELLGEVLSKYQDFIEDHSSKVVEKQNWNAEWEQNYDPIVIENKCIVKATFHQIDESYSFEITINPKMSFGTGHHETTYQILNILMDFDCHNKLVMDAGCGTGVLAIMAKLRGARHVEAFDIDDWCIENSQENFDLNDCSNCHVQLGTLGQLKFEEEFDLVIANINKNVLLNEMHLYADNLKTNGDLILSGFYTQDVEELKVKAAEHNLSFLYQTDKKNWAAAVFRKLPTT